MVTHSTKVDPSTYVSRFSVYCCLIVDNCLVQKVTLRKVTETAFLPFNSLAKIGEVKMIRQDNNNIYLLQTWHYCPTLGLQPQMTFYNPNKPKGKHHLKFYSLCENDHWCALVIKNVS